MPGLIVATIARHPLSPAPFRRISARARAYTGIVLPRSQLSLLPLIPLRRQDRVRRSYVATYTRTYTHTYTQFARIVLSVGSLVKGRGEKGRNDEAIFLANCGDFDRLDSLVAEKTEATRRRGEARAPRVR